MKSQTRKKRAADSFVDYNKRHYLAAVVLLVSIFLAYSNSLHGTWALDDVIVNRRVGMQDIRTLIGFRGVAYLTFLLNQRIAPFTPLYFRVFNLVLHFLNAALIYIMAYKTMLSQNGNGEPMVCKATGNWESAESRAYAVALVSSALFALHPLNINAVAYIIQRMALLATFFVLLSLLSYIAAARSSKMARAAFFYMLSTFSLIVGIFSKENAVMAIPLILLYDYLFLARQELKLLRKKVIIVAAMGLASIGVGSYFLNLYSTFTDLVSIIGNFNRPLTEKGWMAIDVYWTPLQHLLTEFRVVTRYVFLVFAPLPRFLVFDWWGYPVSRGLTEPLSTLFSTVFVVALLIFSLLERRRFPLLAFGILWYLIAISLESFLSVGSDLYFEHRNYLPLAGLTIGIAGQASISFRMSKKFFLAIASALCLLLGAATFTRNFVWKDSLTLWGDTLKKNPSNLRAMMSLGNAYLKLSDTGHAENYYKEVIKASVQNKRAYYLNESAYSLGMIYLFRGELDKAKRLIDGFDIVIDSYKPKILKAYYESLSGDLDRAIKDFTEVLPETTESVDTVMVHTLLGDAYRAKGMLDSASDEYAKALSLDPGLASAYYGMGVIQMSRRNVSRANDYFSKALELDPDNSLVLSDMADLTLISGGNLEVALKYARRAVAKSPFLYQPYLTMGNILTIMGREKEAEEFYREAVKYRMREYMIPFNKARAYYLKGDREKARYYLSELRRYKDLPENLRGILSH